MTRAGFVGLGDMGSRMALRIAAAGLPLTVFDPRPEPMDALVVAGAHAAANAGLVAADAEVIGICVVTVSQLEAIIEQMAPYLDDSKLLCIHSSIAPSAMRSLGARITELGARVLDAPVSGSRPAADAGTLTLIVGGGAQELELAREVMDCYAGQVFSVGPLGSGQALKLTNNIMLHMNHLVALEAVRFAAAQGIDEKTVLEIVNSSTGRSWVTETWGLIDDMLFDHPQAGTDELFAMMSKDMWEAVLAARDSLTAMPLTAAGVHLSMPSLVERRRYLGLSR